MAKQTEWVMDPSNECPECGEELPDNFDTGDIYIDPDLGFVTLTAKCPKCKETFELFFDYNRTETKEK